MEPKEQTGMKRNGKRSMMAAGIYLLILIGASFLKESADIQTPDMLKLPVPEAEYENVILKPSEYQQDRVASLADRAEAVRNRMVEPYQDNMLKITNDERKLALDQRLINDMLPDDANTKFRKAELFSRPAAGAEFFLIEDISNN